MVGQSKEGGFSFLEIAVAMLLIVILAAVAILAVTGFFSSAEKAAMEADLDNVKSAVDSYMTRSLEAPTTDGKLPQNGEYALIDFNASFNEGAKRFTFCPDFLSQLPRHHDEGVWQIDCTAKVSLDLPAERY